KVGYVYNVFNYQTPANAAQSFAALSGVPGNTNLERGEVILWQISQPTWGKFGTRGGLGAWDARGQGLGGWTLNVHHYYDPIARTLYQGDGQRRSADNIPNVIQAFAGTGEYGFSGD